MDCNLQSDVALMAVFDGHGGAECAAYCCAHLPAEFVRALNANPTSLEASMKQAFERLGMLPDLIDCNLSL